MMIDAEAEKIKAKTNVLSKKPESDPRVLDIDEFVRNMTDEIREQKEMVIKAPLNGQELSDRRTKEGKWLQEEAEKIKAETKELSQKPESDPQVVETAEFVTMMTKEILKQKARLTKSNLNDTGKRSNPQNRMDGVFERFRRKYASDHSIETIESKHKLRTEGAAKKIMEDCAHYRKYHDVLKGEYDTSMSLEDEKGMSGDQFIQTITTCDPEYANNSASLKDVCSDVKKYIQQISKLVEEKICSLPQEVRRKLESVMMSFQRLIAGMWKLLLYDLLLYEMTSLFATYQREESTISRKTGRFKYGFQMASMMALWLAHDVESNPGPSFGRNLIDEIMEQEERLTKCSAKGTVIGLSSQYSKEHVNLQRIRTERASDGNVENDTQPGNQYNVLKTEKLFEVEKIKAETKELSQKPESDPQVVESAEFVTMMTEEILEQKARLTKSNLNETGKRSNPQNRMDGVFERLRRKYSSDHSIETIESKHKLRTEGAAKEIMEDCAHYRKYHDVLKGEYDTSMSLEDEKGMSGDQFIQTITTCDPEYANNSASLKDVCSDVKKYIQQISKLVEEKICSLPQEVRRKLESVMMSFQRLIAGMWKLLLYDLLLYEMTSLFATYQREESTISRKTGRFKYGFQMASMMALWLAHDVESNPGPSFGFRSSLERIIRDLSEVLRYHLPVEGSLWSESVAAAAYAAGYSTDCHWSNPSGTCKFNLMTLIERATELGRFLTTWDCLPEEIAPFVNDLGNYAVQQQLVIHYKLKNLRSAVDIILGISSLGVEHKQAIMHEIQRLKQIPHYSERPVDSGRMCNPTDFDRLADSSTSHPTSCYQKKTMRRKPKLVRNRKDNGNHFDNLEFQSQNSAVPEPEVAVTLGQQMDPGSDGTNEASIVPNLDKTSSTVSKVQEVTVQEDMTIKSLSAIKTDRTSTSDEVQTFSVGAKESEPFGSTGNAISILNEIIDSNVTIKQSHEIEMFDDILVWLDGTVTQVQNLMDDDAKNTDIPRTATKTSGMTQMADDNLNYQLTTPPAQNSVVPFSLESDQICQAHASKHMKTERYIGYSLKYDAQIMELMKLIPGQNASCMENISWSAEGNANSSGLEESSMNVNQDIRESDNASDSTLQENAVNHLERDRDNFTQDRAEAGAEEHMTEDDDSTEHFVPGKHISKTESETEFLQQTTSPHATGSNICHGAVKDEVTSVEGGRRKGAEGDTCENEAQTLSSKEEQFATAETETEPIQQTVSPLATVTNSYPDADIDEMYREETVDENTSRTRENQAEDLTLGTEQFASTEPADTRKQSMEPTVDEHFAKFKTLLLKEFEARLEAFKATIGYNTPNGHVVQNKNEEPLDCASSHVEHTEPRVRSSDTSRKRKLTDPENGPTPKKWRQQLSNVFTACV